MAAPKGNKNAKGNKGGRRKSAYEEKADADFLWAMFTKKMTNQDVKELLTKKEGRSILEGMVAKAWSGNEKYTVAMFKKLFPDNLNLNDKSGQRTLKQLEESWREMFADIGKYAQEGEQKPMRVTRKKAAKKTTKKVARKKK